ncbi:MAG: hypothetical protein QXW79_01695 [Thermoplasmata archaeon]
MSILQDHDNVTFYDENGNKIDQRYYERDEQMEAYHFVPPDGVVLELGARYGVVSCLINRILNNPKNHLVVEPDKNVIPALLRNRYNSNREFHIFNGTVSRKPLRFIPNGISSYTIIEDKGNILTLTIEQIEKIYGLKFDVLVSDCEGFIIHFARENDLGQFKMIVLEKDYPMIYDEEFENQLFKKNFIRISNRLASNNCYMSAYANMNFLPFKIISYQVSRGTIGLFGKLGYEAVIDGVATTSLNIKKYGNNIVPISVHANSNLIIETNKHLTVRGCNLSTSKKSPKITFLCDKMDIGTVSYDSKETKTFNIEPGLHEFIINTDCIEYAYSILLFQERESL